MSTDLQLRQIMPEIRLPAIKLQTPQSSDLTDDNSCIIQIEKTDSGDDECHTPKSQEHKIPAILNCPPAPKKPRPVVLAKRKLSELQFFEIVAREEVESFFRSSTAFMKRRSFDGLRCRQFGSEFMERERLEDLCVEDEYELELERERLEDLCVEDEYELELEREKW